MVIGCRCRIEGLEGIMWVHLLVARNLDCWLGPEKRVVIPDRVMALFLMELKYLERIEASIGKRVLNISSQLTKPPKIPMLAEISNREGSRKKHMPLTASKYRVSAGTNKGHLNQPLKENLSGVLEGTTSKSINKGKQISTKMEENLEDSDVLKILHKDMIESVGAVGPPPPQLVDVSSANDLEAVASNLREAMEVAL
ncbi:hypothetical protein Q3G72_029272 [Acer saccharum]|nr:hypothetical protein Q3G72_029272 [Acer saccharum]